MLTDFIVNQNKEYDFIITNFDLNSYQEIE